MQTLQTEQTQNSYSSLTGLGRTVAQLQDRALRFATSFSSLLFIPLDGSIVFIPSLHNAAYWAGRCW